MAKPRVKIPLLVFMSEIKNDLSLKKSNFLFLFCLKVGSCPNDDDSVKNTYIFCYLVFKNFYFPHLLLPRKPSDYAEKCCFSFINFLCTNDVLEFLF